ncbi:MAG: class II aldolase/adducin family protein [Sulfolobales archaeon]|nr:class II aldolase/adducin family protein [Sulfolobales archaeon]MDW8083368.1 class II aldolase/adducin family protein [Sulfolobales archaeon]
MESSGSLLDELCWVMKYMYAKGLISALSGNISIKLDSTKIAITPSGKIKFLLKPEDISIVNTSGECLSGPKPSVEIDMHLRIYSSCSECKSVVHAHGLLSPLLVGLLEPVENLEIRAYGIKICYVGELPPGSRELAEAVSKAVSTGCKAVVLKNHGIVGVGRSLGEALEVIEAVENSFKKSLVLYVLNKLKAISM